MTNDAHSLGSLELRPVKLADVEPAAQILFDAFKEIHDYHRFPGAYPSPETAAQAIQELVEHPAVWSVAATLDGRLVGSTFVDDRSAFAALGPLSIDRALQARGLGRRLMQEMIDHAASARGACFLQDAFNSGSLGLYVTLGAQMREPLVLVAGFARGGDPPTGFEVRTLRDSDIDACEQLCRAVLGFERTAELRDALDSSARTPMVAMRDGEIVAYVTSLSYYPAGHAVASSDEAMCALIAELTKRHGPASFVVPTRQHALFRWVLNEGFRIYKPLSYMTIGEYSPPQGCWIPSAVY